MHIFRTASVAFLRTHCVSYI